MFRLKSRIIVMGGSFSPPHLAHLEVAKHCLDIDLADQVWVQPCAQSAWGKNNIPFPHRIKMCQLAAEDIKNVVASSYEYDHPSTASTYQIIKEMCAFYPECDFSFLLGQDNANKIKKFTNYEKMLEEVKFVVVPRKGVPIELDWFTKPPHMYLDWEDVRGISSTDFRNLYKSKPEEAKKFLAPKVYQYIVEQKLYQD